MIDFNTKPIIFKWLLGVVFPLSFPNENFVGILFFYLVCVICAPYLILPHVILDYFFFNYALQPWGLLCDLG